MTDAGRERAALCDLLTQLGPDQPTLCEGWATRDLTAHLLLREHRPDAAIGAILPTGGYTARVQRKLAAGDYRQLVDRLRQRPWWLRLDRIDQAMNGMELFIHHEDVRRAQPGWDERPLPREQAAGLWSRARLIARLRLRRFPARLRVVAPEFGEVSTGRGGEEVTLSGAPGELVLFLTGRQRAATVSLTGPRQLTDRLTAARLGL